MILKKEGERDSKTTGNEETEECFPRGSLGDPTKKATYATFFFWKVLTPGSSSKVKVAWQAKCCHRP